MARRRKTKKLQGLGLTAAHHKSAAKEYGVFLADTINLLKRDLEGRRPSVGRCRSALNHLGLANRAAAAVFVHHASRGVRKSRRAAMVSKGTRTALDRLEDRYLDSCVRE